MKLYKGALAQGWKLSSSHPWLWLFGLFALFISGNGGQFDFYFKNVNKLVANNSIVNPIFWQNQQWQLFFQRIFSLWSTNAALFIILAATLLLAVIFVVYFSIISEIALIHAANQYPKKSINFHDCFLESHRHFWSILSINLITKAFIILFIFVIAIPLLHTILQTADQSFESLYYLVMILLLLPIVLFATFVDIYAVNYIIIKEERIFAAIKKAVKLFSQNWLVSMEMALIIFILSLLFGLFLILAVMIIVFPFVSTSILASTNSFLAIVTIGIILFLLSIVFFGAIFSAWQRTSWTYLFLNLTTNKHQSKLVRILRKQ